jgi:hypothetical protein
MAKFQFFVIILFFFLSVPPPPFYLDGNKKCWSFVTVVTDDSERGLKRVQREHR